MATYALCAVCGKGTRVARARQCTYCGDYVCRKHRKNGLCPRHENIMSKENADALLLQDNIHHWLGRLFFPLIAIFFLFSALVFTGDIISLIIGFTSLGMFVVTLVSFILISRVLKKKMANILVKVNLELVGIKTISCPKCGQTLIPGIQSCPNCGQIIGSQSILGTVGSSISLKSGTISSPTHDEYSRPLPHPAAHASHQAQYIPPPPPTDQLPRRDLPPPPPPVEQQRDYKPIPPPPQDYRQNQLPPPPPPPQETYTSNQDINSILEEIVAQNPDSKIEVTGFYDEATNSGYHVCQSCGKKFATTGSTSHCPYCNKPLHGTR